MDRREPAPVHEERLAANRRRWDERVGIHVRSAMYDVEGFKAGRDPFLFPWMLDELGDIAGADLVHLQCHFGMDTLGLARRGAVVTGLDFSEPAIDRARALAEEIGVDARFECADVYDAPAVLATTYDVVFTGIGALNWLPDARRWAEVVAALLKPGGFLYLAEMHPVAWALGDDAPSPTQWYLERPEPVSWDEPGTYADLSAPTVENEGHEWNHGLGEIVTALVDAGLVLVFLHERVDLFYPARPYLVERSPGAWSLPEGELPLLFSLRATSRS